MKGTGCTQAVNRLGGYLYVNRYRNRNLNGYGNRNGRWETEGRGGLGEQCPLPPSVPAFRQIRQLEDRPSRCGAYWKAALACLVTLPFQGSAAHASRRIIPGIAAGTAAFPLLPIDVVNSGEPCNSVVAKYVSIFGIAEYGSAPFGMTGFSKISDSISLNTDINLHPPIGFSVGPGDIGKGWSNFSIDLVGKCRCFSGIMVEKNQFQVGPVIRSECFTKISGKVSPLHNLNISGSVLSCCSRLPPQKESRARKESRKNCGPGFRRHPPWYLAIALAIGGIAGVAASWPYKKKPRDFQS